MRFPKLLRLLVIGFCLAHPARAQFALVSSNPGKYESGVVQNQSIHLSFNQSVDPSTVAGSISVVSAFRGEVSGVVSTSGNAVTVDPDLDFLPGEEISVTIYTSLMSMAASPLSTAVGFRFTAKVGASNASPPAYRDREIHRDPDGIALSNKAIDFDKDGDIDMVTVNLWLENDGEANFTYHAITPEVTMESFDVADLDLDGDFDLVIGSSYLGITILINDGQFQFTSTRLTGDFINATSVGVADFDSNGFPDILYSRDQQNTNILYNQGGNVFTSTAIDNTRADKVVIVDFDLDGDWDVIQQDSPQVRLLTKNGSVFVSSLLFTGNGNVRDISVNDFDFDGDIDIVSAEDESLRILENDGSGTLVSKEIGETVEHLTAGDYDGDDDLDLIFLAYTRLEMLVNDGDNNFTRVPVGSPLGFSVDHRGISNADADGDGDLDFFAGINQVTFRWYENSLLETVYPFSAIPGAASVALGDSDWADYDTDGDLDLLIAGYVGPTPTTAVYSNDNGTFNEVAASLPGVYAGSCDWGDFDKDGDYDILLMGSTATGPITRIYKNTGGSFALLPSSAAQLPTAIDGMARWADFNNDGWLDIIIHSQAVHGIYRSDGAGNFQLAFTHSWVFSDAGADVADFDGDGDTDFVVWGSTGSSGDPSVHVYRNDGNFEFSPVSGDFRIRHGGNMSWSDVDNDGDLDLLAGGSSSFSVYECKPAGFEALITQPSWSVNGAIASGDIDNDGDADVLASIDPSLWFMRNDGTGLHSIVNAPMAGIVTRTISFADYDRDHDLDAYGRTILRNNHSRQNTKPLAPSQVVADSVYNNAFYFHWSSGSDAETATPGLSYQPYLGTQPATQNILPANADLASGVRSLATLGGNKGLVGSVTSLYGGVYYFGVQTIDASFEGSAFSPEGQVLVIGIHGNLGACRDGDYSYVAKPSGNYTWSVTGGTIIYGQGTDSVVVKWNANGRGYVRVTGAGNERNTLPVDVDEKPNMLVVGDLTVCTGEEPYVINDPFTHSAEWVVSGSNTVLNPTATGASINWTVAGQYQLTVTGFPEHKGCSDSETITINVDQRPNPQIEGADRTCSGQVEKYATLSSGPTWEVTNGTKVVDSTSYIRVQWPTSTAGQVKLTVPSANGFCQTVKTVQVNVYLTPPKPYIIANVDTMWASPSPIGWWEWFYEGESIALGPYVGVVTDIAGLYAVAIFTVDGCSAISDPYPHLMKVVTGLEDQSRTEGVVVFPNPVSNELTVQLEGEDSGPRTIGIYSVTGSLMRKVEMEKTVGTIRHSVDVSALSPGLYLITVEGQGTVQVARFLKN